MNMSSRYSYMQAENQQLLRRIEIVSGKQILAARTIQPGYTPAKRLIVQFVAGQSVFAKIGTTQSTSAWLRAEKEVYEALEKPFMPHYLGWDDDGDQLMDDYSRYSSCRHPLCRPWRR